ncbi:diguanylate cyclase [Desemzia incerta]|uniref:Diguanylate cyclase n=1 Tax=Desemzia incerta TaxID=82801 RepID=A0A1I5W6U6_9LACT|nr:GGDEF domain-containing protein [Desemzia incerta]SFQ15465.1 diguanylate cyclase [Desemzia incerta]
MLSRILLSAVANVAILTLVSYIFIKIIPKKRTYALTGWQKILLIFIASITSFILMSFSVDLPQQVKIDMRYNAMILLLYYIGPATFIPAALITAFLRLSWGISDAAVYTFILYIILSVLMPLLNKWISKRFNSYTVGLTLNFCYVLGHGVVLYFVYHDWNYVIATSFFNFLFSSCCLLLNIMFIEDMRINVRLYLDEIERAKSDYLTGLYNKREFSYYWTEIENDSTITHTALLMLDIDHFKCINDQYGHLNGDIILRQVASLLHVEDIEHEQIYRVGGEEFCIVLKNKSFSQQMAIAEKIRQTVENNPFKLENHQTIHLTVSVGMATSYKVKDMKNLYRLADRALYQAKERGRNQLVVLDLAERELKRIL